MTAFEYRRATWEEVCALGPQGWRLVAVPPIVEMRQTLGQMQAGEPLYVVEREGKPKYGAALEPAGRTCTASAHAGSGPLPATGGTGTRVTGKTP